MATPGEEPSAELMTPWRKQKTKSLKHSPQNIPSHAAEMFYELFVWSFINTQKEATSIA